MSPLFQEIAYLDPSVAFRAFADYPGAILLESAQKQPDFGRYSFLMADPWQILESKQGKTYLDDQEHNTSFFDLLQDQLNQYKSLHVDGFPPFQGGVAGYLGYEMGQFLETFSPAEHNELGMSDAWLGFYDALVAFDHQQNRAWIVSTGLPALNDAKSRRAQQRLEWLNKTLQTIDTAPFQKTWPSVDIESDVSQVDYCTAVQQVIDFIYAGDIYQANYSRRLRTELPLNVTAYDLYEQLSKVNPAPFAAYIQTKEGIIASASPERFLKLDQQSVETKPIKGTKRRSKDPVADQQAAEALLASEKDRAENVMIVDLMRNDLSRVCLPHSVKVPHLLALESYENVHHLVTTVVGALMPHHDAVDLLKATFPGGSITGAPKIRAMEIITALEKQARGPFYGAIGYIGFSGMMDTNIVIRTFVIQGKKVIFQVGGGIVADSDPQEEYDESTTKALGLIKALYSS
jgi:para-aminobenzoate synthetase component 1